MSQASASGGSVGHEGAPEVVLADITEFPLSVDAVLDAVRHHAFEVCRGLIEATKASVPIWKHQLFEDGSDEWVGTL